MDLRYFLLFVIVSVSLESIDGQVTQCTTAEYRAVVLGLEALRAQFKTEIANLMTIITTMNETIQDLLPEEITTNVRLVGGNVSSEGRVEVYYTNIWGTICDDSFDNDDATVICRMLGYNGTSVGYQNAEFGRGTGPIWLDEMECIGTEASLLDCSHNGWGQHDCGHDEDASVKCSNDMI